MQAYIKNNSLIICDLLEDEKSKMSDLINDIINGANINPIHNVEGDISGIKISPINVERRD